MKLSFRVGGFNIKLGVTYAPIETYGVGSLTPYGHMTFIDVDDTSEDLSSMSSRVSYLMDHWNYVHGGNGFLGLVVLKSSCNSYHLIDPSINAGSNVVEKMMWIHPGCGKHVGMGLVLGKWVLRIGKKGDKGNPELVGVIPSLKPVKCNVLVYDPMLELLDKLPRLKIDLEGTGIIDYNEWCDVINDCDKLVGMDGPLLFDRYSTVARSNVKQRCNS